MRDKQLRLSRSMEIRVDPWLAIFYQALLHFGGSQAADAN
jgi:hypothetical protein